MKLMSFGGRVQLWQSLHMVDSGWTIDSFSQDSEKEQDREKGQVSSCPATHQKTRSRQQDVSHLPSPIRPYCTAPSLLNLGFQSDRRPSWPGGPAGWAMNGQVSGSPAKLPGLLEKATLAHESPELPAGSCMGHIAHNGLMWLNSSPVNILIS